MVEGYVVLQYIMEYCTILFFFYVGMRFELDYNNNLYCVDDIGKCPNTEKKKKKKKKIQYQ